MGSAEIEYLIPWAVVAGLILLVVLLAVWPRKKG